MKARPRHLLFLLLAFTLLFSQQGAAIHALSHLSEPLSSTSPQDKHLPHSSACDKCVAYAGIGSAIAASELLIPPTAIHLLPVAALQPTLLSQPPARPYQARAPPALV